MTHTMLTQKLPLNKIDAISDPEQQAKLRWANCLDRLRNGVWGDHMAVQGIAMFSM